jgi:hypothetical protein
MVYYWDSFTFLHLKAEVLSTGTIYINSLSSGHSWIFFHEGKATGA